MPAGSLAFGCGQCMPCRINKQRLWVHRLMLEALKHGDSSFITLTYDDDHVPDGNSLYPKDTQDWLKRLRSELAPQKIRYYLVGEYADPPNERPHYHVALFGYAPCLFHPGPFEFPLRKKCKCPQCSLIRKTWGKGFVDVGSLTPESARYICGYVTKKMTNKNNEKVKEFLKGRHPEFARMSLRPGIGATAVADICLSLLGDSGARSLLINGDVPFSLKHGKRNMPLGRYLRERLRLHYGFEEKGTPKEVLQKVSQEMSEMFSTALEDPKNKNKSIKQILLDSNAQKVRNLEAKVKIFKTKKGSL